MVRLTINQPLSKYRNHGKRICNAGGTDRQRTTDGNDTRQRPHVMGYQRICRNRALRIKVHGRLHAGYVIVALNGSDYYEVYLQKDRDMECINEEVCFDELGEVIDRAIEKGSDEKEYEAFCHQQLTLLLGGKTA